MNATLRILLVASSIALGMILSPCAEAQVSRPAPTKSSSSSRNDRNNNNHSDNKKPGKPGDNKKPGKPGGNKKPGKPDGNKKPGKPSGNKKPGYRPPSHPAPAPRPGSNWSTPVPPPHRAYRPMAHPIPRPMVPHGYRPCPTAPVIRTILGITFGTLYHASLDYFYHKGYEIDGYCDNTVYLRNVPELGYTWPDATVYYDSYGRLAGSQFCYSTAFSSTVRYDHLYSTLCATYGSPVSANWSGSHRETVWYGGDARGYVSLEYDYSAGRFYTILSYGI